MPAALYMLLAFWLYCYCLEEGGYMTSTLCIYGEDDLVGKIVYTLFNSFVNSFI